MVVARLAASLLAAVAMGWLWLRLGKAHWLRTPERPELAGLSRGAAFVAACRTDLTQAGGFLGIGAMTAATLNVAVPPKLLHTVGGHAGGSGSPPARVAVGLWLCAGGG